MDAQNEGYKGNGRPSKVARITEQDWRKIEKALRDGVPYMFVCDLAHVDISTWNDWMSKGRKAKSEGQTDLYSRFRDRVEGCKSDHVRLAMAAMGEGDKGHKGHEWVLSRRHPKQFHQGTKLEHSGKVDGDHTVTVFDASTLIDLEDVDDMGEDND